MKSLVKSVLILAGVAMSGCTTVTEVEDPATYLHADVQPVKDVAIQDLERRAYERGVADVLADFKGQIRSREGRIWQKPVIEYVTIPATVRNGILIPEHTEPVVIRPGQWIEADSVRLPEIGD